MLSKLDKANQKKAIALNYDPDSSDAPVISAAGQGHMAQRIIDEAKKSDVPVVEDKDLTEILAQFSVGDQIPPSLYEAVAQILIFISGLDSKG